MSVNDFWGIPQVRLGDFSDTRITIATLRVGPYQQWWEFGSPLRASCVGCKWSLRGARFEDPTGDHRWYPEAHIQTPMVIEKWREWFPESMIGFDLADLSPAKNGPLIDTHRLTRMTNSNPGRELGQEARKRYTSWPPRIEAGRSISRFCSPACRPYAGTYSARSTVRAGYPFLHDHWSASRSRVSGVVESPSGSGRSSRRISPGVFIFVANMLIWVLAASHVKGLTTKPGCCTSVLPRDSFRREFYGCFTSRLSRLSAASGRKL